MPVPDPRLEMGGLPRARQISAALSGLDEILAGHGVRAVVVQGDTNAKGISGDHVTLTGNTVVEAVSELLPPPGERADLLGLSARATVRTRWRSASTGDRSPVPRRVAERVNVR